MQNNKLDYVKLINKYTGRAVEKLRSIIKNFEEYDDKELDRIMQSINDSTIVALKKNYIFNEPLPGPPNAKRTPIFGKYQDFDDWLLITMCIPLYHSLGDTIGYHNGHWEFNYGEQNAGPEYANELIYEFISLGGINDLSITNWMASDDTIMYMATYHVLSEKVSSIQEFGKKLQQAYLEIFPIIENRHIGNITERSLVIQKNIEWDKLPYNNLDIGAGSCMRSGCIGIFFLGWHNRKKLIALAVESSRITHNSTTAILGSICTALFTAYALERVPINHWPHKFIKLLKSNRIDRYMEKSRPNEYHLYQRDKVIYIGQWEKYINMRFSGLTPRLDLKIMKNPVSRIEYLAKNFSKGHMEFPGSCADDAVIMAYDALLESGNVLEKLIVYAILHPGDSDTVGAIALSWFGAYYHSPKNGRLVYPKFEELEYYQKIVDATNKNPQKMLKIYYYDLYYHVGRKILKKILVKQN